MKNNIFDCDVVKILPNGPCGTLVSISGREAVVSCVADDGNTELGEKTAPITEIEPVTGTPHHPNGPSRLRQRAECPGSRLMEQGWPETTSKFAAEGTMLHEAVEKKHLRKNCNEEQKDLLDICDRALAEYPVKEWLFERRIAIMDTEANPFFPPLLLFGTADAVGWVDDDTMILGEFKFGRVEVDPPENNLQIAAEAVGLWQEFGCKRIIAVLIQPRVRPEPKVFEFTQFEALEATIIEICRKTEDDQIVLKAGDHCTYCKAKTVCPALMREEDGLVQQENRLPITPQNAADIKKKIKAVRSRLDAIEKEIVKMVIAEAGDVPGFVIVNKRGARTIEDPQKAYDSLSDLLTVNEFMSACTVSVAKIEELVAQKLKAAGACKTKAQAKEKFLEMVEVKYGEGRQEVRLK